MLEVVIGGGDSVVSGGQVGATRRTMSEPNDAVSGIKFALELAS